jgi:hypothetical protein
LPRATPRVPIELASLAEAQELEGRIRLSAAEACAALSALLRGEESLDVLRAIKFRRIGFDPLDPERPLNLVEKVHQTFTYLVSLRGVEYLLLHHPEHAPFRLNLGTLPGSDIISADGVVAAEVFAAVTPQNNNKLASDIARMRSSWAACRYVFYYAEVDGGTVTDPEVTIVSVEL